jgi:hypothetical protein
MPPEGYGQQLREDIARLILAERAECPKHPPGLPKPSCWACGRNGAFTRAARSALGRPTNGGARRPRRARVRWRDLPRVLMVRRPAAIAMPAGDGGEPSFTEKYFDPGLIGDPVKTLSLPSGTVLTGADHDALVTRFTAHARVLIGNGLCPLHEMPLDPVRLDPVRPQSRFFGGECAACGRGWQLGPVTPYVLTGSGVTGGEPLQRDEAR